MTRTETPPAGRLVSPVRVSSFPFVTTLEVESLTSDPGEPSPCLASATSAWFALRPGRGGRVVVDLAGSTPLDPVARLYRQVASHPASLVFVGCASPVWNAQSSLETTVGRDETLLAQIGTSESAEGRLVVRFELRSPPLG